ncbi:MAG: MBL fold metallo-hydrolase [Syntrophobacterales bacterium]|jgi:7,8-dihydropterin-6-yl-methyl-4-(beta-D-ribofuranosyl)aminobenzene 5'-phosphate synthase
MKLTIIYDNKAWAPGLQADWGFACLLDLMDGSRLLFDTGANGTILLENMDKIGIDPQTVSSVFISHAHWDHIGGLPAFLERNREVVVYLPDSFPKTPEAGQVLRIQAPYQLAPQLWSTGELNNGEQSLVVDTGQGLAVVCGCAHPGVEAILQAAAQFGRVTALVGGLHGFQDFDLLQDLSLVCPCHCTLHINEIKQHYPKTYVPGGAGQIVEI